MNEEEVFCSVRDFNEKEYEKDRKVNTGKTLDMVSK